jgi:hypothetical protein
MNEKSVTQQIDRCSPVPLFGVTLAIDNRGVEVSAQVGASDQPCDEIKKLLYGGLPFVAFGALRDFILITH